MTQTMIVPNKVFAVKRAALLMRLDLCTNYKTIITFAAALASVLFLYFLASPGREAGGNFHPQLYAVLLFVGGFYITSLAFKDLHDDARSYAYLTLPCSNFEKFFNKLLVTSLGYVVALSAGYFLLSLVTNGIGWLLFNEHQTLFNPLATDALTYVRSYLVWQSLFLLGSAYFRKHVMSKIILTICCFTLILLGFISCSSSLFFSPSDMVALPYLHLVNGDTHWVGFVGVLPHFVKVIFWICLAPFCWVVTYLRLTEMELGA